MFGCFEYDVELMQSSLRHCFTALCVSCLVVSPLAVADARDRLPRIEQRNDHVGCPDTAPGLSIEVDNDLFAGAARDADYTGGVALRWTPEDQSVDVAAHRVHLSFDRLLRVVDDSCRSHAWQLGLFSLTPTPASGAVRLDDRPYASALVMGTTALWSAGSGRRAFQSTLELGALGLDIAREVHTAVHRLVGSEEPQGYRHQISNGGELTARYALTQYKLLHDGLARGQSLQVKRVASLSVGYLTESAVGWSMRWGRINSSWPMFAAEFSDYLPSPSPLLASRSSELYALAGARIKLRAYNALAQGQFRDSEHVLHAAELEYWLGEAWFGVHWRSAGNLSITYTVRVQTPELRDGPARRTLVWGGIGVSWSM
jgi:hypothetical protein